MDLHITQFGAAKAGLTLAVLDEGITREGLEKTLKETGAKALIYAPYRGNTDTTAVLQQMIPELASCEFESFVLAYLFLYWFLVGTTDCLGGFCRVFNISPNPKPPTPQTTTPRACPSARPSSRRCGTSSTRAST